MFSSWGAAKAPPSTSAARIPAPPPPTRQSRIRELWAGFEQWHAQAKGAADAKRVEAYKTLDKSHKSNKKNKASKAEHEKAKEQKAREIETELVHSARDEWMRRLSENNLRAEDWDDMSVAETRAVEKLLGDRYEDTTPLAAPAPAAAGSPRGGFVFVDPKALSEDEGDESKKGAAGKHQERPNAHLHHPSDDPAFWNRGALGYAAWSIDSAASSAVSLSSLPTPSSAHSSTPSSARTSPSAGHVPLPPSFSVHAPTPGVASASASAAATASPNPRKHRTLRYIGPVLCEEAHSEEEADFEEFKVQVRITKICEFHDAAAQEDIRLAVELLRLRKEHRAHGTERSVAREQERALVAQHETNMLNLQRDKEEERHRMVAEEREKRRAEIERRNELQHVLKGRTLESRAHLATPTPETIRKAMEGVEEKRRIAGEGGRPANTRLVELQGSAQQAPRGADAARAAEPAPDAHLQEMLRRAEEEGRRMEEAAQRRRAAMQPTSANKQQQQGEVVDMPGGLPLAPSAPTKAPSALKRVEPVKKADSSPPPPPIKKVEPVPAKKAEPAPAPAPAPAPVQKKEPVTKKGKKAAKKAATTTTTTATPTKAPPPSPSLSSPSLSVSSSTSSALSSSTSTTLTTPAQSRQDSTEDLTRQTNSNQGKPAGKRVAFSPTVEADERAAEKEKAAQGSWNWGTGALGSLTSALLGGEQPAPTQQEKGKGKEREVEDAGKSREALVADLRAQAQETLAGFPADTRAHVERMLKEFPAEEGSEVGAPTGYQHVQQPGMWRPSGSSWGEAKAELQNDGWSLEQLAARALQQGFQMDTPTTQAPPQASTSRVPGHVSPPYMPGGISPAHSAGHHSPAHVPGHYSPPQQHIYASPYAAQSQPALNHVPSTFAQGHFAPAQYNAQPGRYSPPQAPVGSFSPPQPASHEIWLPKPEPAKEAKRADAHHGSKHAEVKVAPKQPEAKPEVKSAFRQPEPKAKQPEVKSAAKVVPKAPEVKPAPKVEAKPKVSAPQLARAQPVANVVPQKVATSSSKTALPKAPVMNSASSSSKPVAAPAPHVKVSAPTATKAPAQVDVKHQIWLPSNVPHPHPRNQQHGLTVPGSPALEHSATLPAIAHPTPLLAGSRPRRMSDPVSPSPRMFDRMPVPVVDDAVQPPVQGILKKVKEHIPSKPTANVKPTTTTDVKKPRAIQVEVIPDNEGEPLNVLPSDARSLLEPVTVAPRPSAPPHAFNHIFDYDEPSASGAQTSSSQGSGSNKTGDSAGMNAKAASSGKNDKAKHVRWTPSVAGNAGPAEGPSAADARQLPGKQAQGRPPIRPRASMPATGAEKHGAGQKHGDDLQRIAVEAIENLKQTRNKPPSAV